MITDSYAVAEAFHHLRVQAATAKNAAKAAFCAADEATAHPTADNIKEAQIQTLRLLAALNELQGREDTYGAALAAQEEG